MQVEIENKGRNGRQVVFIAETPKEALRLSRMQDLPNAQLYEEDNRVGISFPANGNGSSTMPKLKKNKGGRPKKNWTDEESADEPMQMTKITGKKKPGRKARHKAA